LLAFIIYNSIKYHIMKKNIQIIIKKNIPHLGEPGTITKTRLGYALNYLIPNNIAEIATPGILKHAEMLKKIKSKQLEEIKIQANIIKTNLEQIPKISIKKKIGDHKQIFGSVSEKDIISYILDCTGQQLEKKQISMPDIKEIGIYTLRIKIIENVFVDLKLQILPTDI